MLDDVRHWPISDWNPAAGDTNGETIKDWSEKFEGGLSNYGKDANHQY